MKKLLLISNSTNAGEAYLGWPRPFILEFALKHGVKDILFIPYAGIGINPHDEMEAYNLYEKKVQSVFSELGLNIHSIHHESNPTAAVVKADCVAVGGGNTWYLVHKMQQLGLMQAIGNRAEEGMPYMGWSAGSNVACPTLRTTNDMPIIEPASFNCMNLIPFQINPHYLDANPEGHGGETRQQRIEEFLVVNPTIAVAGLREASLLEVTGDHMLLKGYKPLRLFRFGQEPQELESGSDLSFLMA